MSACTFFGHRDSPSSIKPELREVLVKLIENHGVDQFYVGNQGAFDSTVHSVLQELKQEHPHIQYTVVLAYMPQRRDTLDDRDFSNSILPEGIESVPKRYAISWRNKWMLRRCDYVVSYITHTFGGAAQFVETAKRQKKTVINLAQQD